VQTGLLAELLQGKAGELLGSGFVVAIVRDAVAAVQDAARDERQAYKLPKILSKRAEKGSSDCAAEGDSGEAV
jgi:hypothetical protein